MQMHTPDIMNKLICDIMDSWLAHSRPILPPLWDGPDEPIKRQLRRALKLKIRLDGVNSSVAASPKHGKNLSVCTTKSENLVKHSHRNSGCENFNQRAVDTLHHYVETIQHGITWHARC
jgi:hypothetical protein